MDEELGDISKAVEKTLDYYDKLRGQDVRSIGEAFWDMVVLSARDEAQREAYQLQIDYKLQCGELPNGITFKVFADPPGPKVGCGGCTMYVLHTLLQQYGDNLYDWRILLINAGGYSQRLPNTSMLGKVFMPIPTNRSRLYQLLDYKLACYLPMLKNMRPGIFMASSDTIEVFDLGPQHIHHFDNDGFTAVAHRNTIQVGQNHGVFVFEKHPSTDPHQLTDVKKVREVLQKPSAALMYERGAVNSDGNANYVYTDSFYFFDHSISRKFIEFYKQEGPFDCELDSYGDFFQPLGDRATDQYVYNTSKVVKVVDSLIPTRKKVFELLKGTPLHVIILNASKFYHLGTISENLQHFCSNHVIAKEMGFVRNVFSAFQTDDKISECAPECGGVILHSIMHSHSKIASSTVVEYCDFSVVVNVEENCIVSNCAASRKHTASQTIYIPGNMFFHTVPVDGANGKAVGYCTILFHTSDNIKQKAATLKNIQYLGKSMQVFLTCLNIDENDEQTMPGDREIMMWETKLFPVMPSMGHSFLAAVNIMTAVQKERAINDAVVKNVERLSMAEIMDRKNVKNMLNYRKDLYSQIISLKN